MDMKLSCLKLTAAKQPVNVGEEQVRRNKIVKRLVEQRELASVRTMYRVLAANFSSAERRNQRNHPVYAKPELLALAPNQVWSWDSVP